MQTKNKKINLFPKAVIFGLLFLSFLFLFTLSGEKAKATDSQGTCMVMNTLTDMVNHDVTAIPGIYHYYKDTAEKDCYNYCSGNSKECRWTAKDIDTTLGIASINTYKNAEVDLDFSCKFFSTPVLCLLSPLLWFVKVLFLGAVTFFGWVINIDNLRLVLTGGGFVYEMWKFIRDILNMVFILVLLFSAFCTIFQVSKYNYKKILLTLVIMALLVNFSFPIARFIIDISNVLMYTLVNLYLNGSKDASIFTTEFLNSSGLGTLFQIKTYTNAGMMLAAVVFLFIFTVTLFAFAILLFIRMMALAILIMFSPIGFVGNVMPGFQSYASKWWDNLFRYAFFGPIMMLGLHISIKMMTTLNKLGDFKSAAADISKNADPNLIGSLAFMMIPIVILWMTMGLAQSMSIAGASTVMGGAQKFLKWTGKNLSGYNAGKWYAKELKKDHVDPIIKAWKDRRNEKKQSKRDYRTAATRDRIGRVLDKGKRDPDYYRRVNNSNEIAKFKKEQELFSTTAEDNMESIKKLMSGKQTRETGQRMQAFLQTMAEKKDLNEFQKLQGNNFDPYSAGDDIYTMLKSNTNISEKERIEALRDIENINLANGVYSMFGLTRVLTAADVIADPSRGVEGQRVKSNRAEQKKAALIKMKQVDYQKFMINFHRDTAITEDSTGKTTGLSDIGVDALKFIEDHGAKYADRLRGENKEELTNAINIYEIAHSGFIASMPNLKRELGIP